MYSLGSIQKLILKRCIESATVTVVLNGALYTE